MLVKETLYTLNDIAVIPAATSNISSRSECNPEYEFNQMLPLFVSPMNNIIDDNNVDIFSAAGVNVIAPRDDENIDYEVRKNRWEIMWAKGVFVGMSMKEFDKYFIEDADSIDMSKYRRVCIDLANGHMESLLTMCKIAKDYYKEHLILMTGNIANPETYRDYAKAGIDYVRLGIGSGSICTTAANSSIHHPMASLIDECKKIKNEIEIFVEQKDSYSTEYKSVPKIVADGGFTNFDQIIKALALGADYCMCGKLFAQCIEACTEVVADKEFVFPEEENDFILKKHNTVKKPYERTDFILDLIKRGYKFERDYYGMSTKRAQRSMGGKGNKTAEGITTRISVNYTISGWIDNFKSYLKSAMSYTGFRRIEDFIGGPVCKIQSTNAYFAYFK